MTGRNNKPGSGDDDALERARRLAAESERIEEERQKAAEEESAPFTEKFKKRAGGWKDSAADWVDQNSPGWLKATFRAAAALGTVGKWLTSPVWWPAKKIVQAAGWGMDRQYSVVTKAATAAVAGVTLAAYFTAAAYTGVYGLVAAGDNYWFGQPYSHGQRLGTIAKLSYKGKWPCNTLEGELAMPNLSKGGTSTFSFSLRSMLGLNGKTEKQLWDAYEHNIPVSLDYDQSHWPTDWFDPESEGYLLPVVNSEVFGCVQKTDYHVNSVTEKPGTQLPGVPKMPGSLGVGSIAPMQP